MNDKSSFSRPPFLGGLYWKTLAMCIILAAGATGQALFAMDAAAQDAEPKSAATQVAIGGRELLPAGQALTAWQPVKGWQEVGGVVLDPHDPKWFKTEPGTGVVLTGGKDLFTKEPFADIEAHVEFVIPRHSNSGVYFMGSYEVQVYDSFGVEKDKYPGIECGGIYPEWINNANVHGHSPLVNASLPPGQWQTFDVVFRAPKFDSAGKKIANARFVKVIHNGKLIQENVELFGPMRGGLAEKAAGPLRLQGDHGPVAFRNIRIRPLAEK